MTVTTPTDPDPSGTSPSFDLQPPAAATPRPRRIAAGAMLLAGLAYLVAEIATAAAWTNPPYDWAENLVPDLGNTGSGTNHLGLVVTSPLHAVMNAGFAIQGLLFGTAAVALSRLAAGRTRRALVALGSAYAGGLVLVAFCTHYPDMSTTRLTANVVGAAVAMIAGNLVLVIAGRLWQQLDLRRRAGHVTVALGVGALTAGLVLTVLAVPVGISERASIEPMILWQIAVGATLLYNTAGTRCWWLSSPPTGAPRSR